jgi:uncharacterized protein (UPF0332 family)
MNKIRWCCKQKKGMSLIEINENLAKSYIKESEESLEVCSQIKGKWRTITSYYACYSALYSILMKCGIKSEIHECTIELMKLLGFSDKEKEFLEELKEKRINCQYYLKEENINNLEEIKGFVLRCKEISNQLNSAKIEEIRKMIKENCNEK